MSSDEFKTEVQQLVERAELTAGGQRALERTLGWPSGNIAAVKQGRRALPAFRAGQLAALVGESEIDWIIDCLKHTSKTVQERKYWEHLTFMQMIRSVPLDLPTDIDPVKLADHFLELCRINAPSHEAEKWKQKRQELRSNYQHLLSSPYQWPGLPDET